MSKDTHPVVSGILPDSGSLEIHTYRRRLPHWRGEGATYLITWRLWSTQRPLDAGERSQVVAALMHFDRQRYKLYAYVVMDDHVHAIAQPMGGERLEQIIQSWKSFTAKVLTREFGRIAPVWQDEYYDRIIRDERELQEKVNYLLDNPFRRWGEISEYMWSGLGS